jgi:hypothetical protein
MKKKNEDQPVSRKSSKVPKKITETKIRELAHSIYLNRLKKGIEGDAKSDWLQAKEELCS